MARTDIFTDEEKCWLKENYPRASWEEIFSASPNKTKMQIISKAHNHRKFHSIYGYGDNTVEQFKNFVQSFTQKDFVLLTSLSRN